MIFYKATAEVYRRYTSGGGFVKKRPKDEQSACGKNTGRKKIPQAVWNIQRLR
ncbi:MAG: hypothetical protein WC292_07250 [Clostridia bacterium]